MSFTPNLNNWITGTAYNVGDITTFGKNLYTCKTYHVAGTFKTDLLGGYWALINQPVIAKNYMASANFEDGTTGMFSLFSTTLTNKIPTGSIVAATGIYPALTAELTSPLTGKYSLQTYIAGDSITAGNGFISDSITIDSEDKAKVMQISFSYSVTSGPNLGNFSGTSSNTWAVYVYDNANSVWIQPAGVYNIIQSSGVGKCNATFQTPSNATSFRIAVICINSNTMGYFQMMWDSFYLGTQTAADASSSPVVANVYRGTAQSIATSSAQKVQFASIAFDKNAAYDATTNYRYNIPTSGVYAINAQVVFAANASNIRITMIYKNGAEIYRAQSNTNIGSQPCYLPVSFTADLKAGDYIEIWAYQDTGGALNIGGSNTTFLSMQLLTSPSSIINSGVIAATLTASTTTSILLASANTISFQTVMLDTNSAFSTVTNRYTIPTSGIYKLSFVAGLINCTAFTTAGRVDTSIHINGSSLIRSTTRISSTGFFPISSVESTVRLNAGDQVEIKAQMADGTYTSNIHNDPSYNKFQIQNLSNLVSTAATETVAARYTNTTGSAVANTETVLNFPTKDYDSHSAVTTGASFKFTAPISGLYEVSVNCLTNVSATPSTLIGRLRKNGTAFKSVAFPRYAAISTFTPLVIQSRVKLLAGEYVDFVLNETVDTNTLETTAGVNSFEVVRVGNYV